MNIEQFQKLQQQHGEKLVYKDGEEFFFIIGNEVDEEECYALQDTYGVNGMDEKIPGLTCWVGYGDDVMNAISVTSLETVPEEVEKFIIANIGENCYTEEEDCE